MEFKLGENVRLYCSNLCENMSKEMKLAREDSGPPMKPLTAKDITDDGFVALVEAIVERASHDVTHFSPGTEYRTSAENFFKSEFFAALSGLEGEPILRDLQEEYNKRNRRLHREEKKRFVTRRVRCVETNKEYESLKSAANALGISDKMLQRHLSGRSKSAAGLHWEYADGGNS